MIYIIIYELVFCFRRIPLYARFTAHVAAPGARRAPGPLGAGPSRVAEGEGPFLTLTSLGSPAAAAQRRGRGEAVPALRKPRRNMAWEGAAVQPPQPAPVSCA